MAVTMNPTSIFSVKFIDRDGQVQIQDYPAAGSREAQEKFAAEHPGCNLINVWRKA